MRYTLLTLVIVLFANGLWAQTHSSSKADAWHKIEPATVTLFSRTKYREEGYGRAAFSFNHGLRSDDHGREVTKNNYELLYGNISLNGDSDWFKVTMVTDDCSRIKDLGEMEWSQISEVPYLEASPEPQNGIRHPAKGESFEESSNGQVTRVAVGHIYIVRSKDRNTDFLTLFRVEELIPSDQVTISWKKLPAADRPSDRP